MQNEFHRGIEKIAVVADENDRAAVALEKILEPENAFEVEKICGFVEQQKIRRGEQDRRQRHAHAPAAGKFAARSHLLRGGKSKSCKNRRGARRPGPAIDRLQTSMNFAKLYGIANALALGDQAQSFLIGSKDGVEQAFVSARRFLCDPANAPTRRLYDCAFVGEQPQQRRFPRAVAAYETDPAPGRQARACGIEDCAPCNSVCDVFDYQHRLGLRRSGPASIRRAPLQMKRS